MRTTKAIASLIILLLLLMSVLTLAVYAQGPEGEGREGRAESQDQVGEQGLADPPTPGLSVLVMFTGAANDTGGNIATAVHCTNFGSSDVQAEIQFFSYDAVDVYTRSVTIKTNATWTFTTQPTSAYTEDSILSTGPLNQGSGRVLVDADHLICTAQVLDPGSDPPVSMVKLPLFDKDGNPFGSKPGIYLPAILKNS
jgi:hypothetical protein